MEKKIIGKEDVDIGALIKKLGNSDWVKSGMKYLDSSSGTCPFCQRELDDTFRMRLEEYFDESYLAALQEIDSLINEYKDGSQRLIQQLNAIAQQALVEQKEDILKLENPVDVNHMEINEE